MVQRIVKRDRGKVINLSTTTRLCSEPLLKIEFQAEMCAMCVRCVVYVCACVRLIIFVDRANRLTICTRRIRKLNQALKLQTHQAEMLAAKVRMLEETNVRMGEALKNRPFQKNRGKKKKKSNGNGATAVAGDEKKKEEEGPVDESNGGRSVGKEDASASR